MKRFFFALFVVTVTSTGYAQSIDDMAELIREGQMMDESNDWVFYGNLDYKLRGVDNEVTTYLDITEPNTTVRMYLVAKTECIVYFDVTDKQEAYVFGTRDADALESDLSNGFKGATSIFTFEEKFLMNINFGVRWGCDNMIDTEMKLLVFYANKNVD